MATAKTYHALVSVDFHTETNLYSLQGSHNPTERLLACSTVKNLNSPAGQWTTTILGDYYEGKIRPMDIAVIKMGRQVNSLDTVMIGLVDSVNVTETMSDGVPRIITTVAGRDFGKVLLKAMIKFFPTLKDEALQALSGSQVLLGLQAFFAENAIETGTPAKFVSVILDRLLNKIMKLSFQYWDNGSKKQGELANILGYRLGEFDYIVPWHTTRDSFEGSIWNFIASARNQPFHELFIDTRSSAEIDTIVPVVSEQGGGGVTFGDDSASVGVFMRPTPFSTADWNRLVTHSLEDDADLIQRSTGINDHEHYNMFRVHPKVDFFGNELEMDGLLPPMFNKDNLSKFGLSFLDTTFEGMFENEQQGDLLSVSKTLTQVLQDWYSRNHELESGTFTVRGDGKYRIGQRLLHPRRNRLYYIEGVTQTFQNFGAWTTDIEVTRGDKV